MNRLSSLEGAQRALARNAASAGHWLQAAWHWDAVLALQPDDSAALEQREAALSQARALGEVRLQQARRAQQRGDSETAQRFYLEAIALVPDQREALQALRAMERERVSRQHLGRLSVQSMARRDMAAALMSTDRHRSRVPAGKQANEIEHATLLAGQGELLAAIQLLQPLAQATPANASARRLLADLQLRQALALAPSDLAAATQAVRESLRWNPGRSEARQLLRRLTERSADQPQPKPRPRNKSDP